jgi:tRNA dimethylallyltransferase
MANNPFERAFVLTGPTASGKTALALPWAQKLDAEIVSMDSMALYRGMDIGTAKPSPDERRLIPHHLIDVLDPWESANVAWWLNQATICVRAIESRGKTALLVGGTPLYLKALLHGMFTGPPADSAIRARLLAELSSFGAPALHRRLAQVDRISAARVHPNDARRITRALEVWEQTGTPISQMQGQWDTASRTPRRIVCLDLPRAELHERINRRVQEMIENGLAAEARQLLSLPYPLGKVASQALGYAEMLAHARGEMPLDDAVARVQTRSRQFAKRQMTWFRGLTPCQMVAARDFAREITEGNR